MYDVLYLSKKTNGSGSMESVFPSTLTLADRLAIKARMEKESLTLVCGCSLQKNQAPLSYGVTKDGKIYPLHHDYIHASSCVRSQKNRTQLIVSDAETGNTNAYISFRAYTFSVPKMLTDVPEEEESPPSTDFLNHDNNESTKDKEHIDDTPSDETELDSETELEPKEEEKEPYASSLAVLVRELIMSHYMRRVLENKPVLSADYFTSSLISSFKNVYLNMKKDSYQKSLHELDLLVDYHKFFYKKLKGIRESGNGSYYVDLITQNRTSSNFLFLNTLLKEARNFEKQYGMKLVDALNDATDYEVMAAGFLYRKVSKRGKFYTVIGRIHFFLISRQGLYMDSFADVAAHKLLFSFARQKELSIILDTGFHDCTCKLTKKGFKSAYLCKKKPRGLAIESPVHFVYLYSGQIISHTLQELYIELENHPL